MITSEQKNEIAVIRTEAVTALAELRLFSIVTADDMETASLIRADLKTKIKQVEDRRKEITGPLNTALKSVNSLFKPITDSLNASVVVLNGAITEARREAEQQAQAALAALTLAASEADSEGITEAIQAHDVAVSSVVVTGLSFRKVWKARVTDEVLIPREFLIPDLGMLGALATETKGPSGIPGVEFYSEEIVAGSRS